MTRENETPNSGDPRVFWIRMKMSDAKTPEANEKDARRVLMDAAREPSVQDVQMVTDVGLINLIGAGIHDAFTDAAADADHWGDEPETESEADE
jgi:hypothetical protein